MAIMTHKDRIERAANILGVEPIGVRLYLPYQRPTKKSQRAAEKLANILRRLEIALKDPDLNLEPGLIEEIRNHIPTEKLQGWCAACEKQIIDDDGNHLKLGTPKRHDGYLKRRAAEHALWLMQKHGVKLRGQRFYELAAVLYGDMKAVESMERHCKAARDASKNVYGHTGP